jgi:hypothetical protein
MALWQMDLVGGIFLADGTEAKLVTGVDDHSRFCVICQVVVRATGRAVCLAFAAALRQFGVPGEVLTDNGKQFTDRFGKGREVLFDRICPDNGIVCRLTQPGHPTTIGKIERFQGSLRRELLNDAVPFAGLADAQAAIDGWVSEYNTIRPHQAIGMAAPAERFSTAAARAEQQLLPLRLPAVIALAPVPPSPADPRQAAAEADPAPVRADGQGQPYRGGPVEFERVVPASGNTQVARRQFWLGPHRCGMTVTFWAGTGVIHLSIGGAGSSPCAPTCPPRTWLPWPPREDGLPGRRPCPRPSPEPRSRPTGSSAATARSTPAVSTSRPGKSPPAARPASASRTRP